MFGSLGLFSSERSIRVEVGRMRIDKASLGLNCSSRHTTFSRRFHLLSGMDCCNSDTRAFIFNDDDSRMLKISMECPIFVGICGPAVKRYSGMGTIPKSRCSLLIWKSKQCFSVPRSRHSVGHGKCGISAASLDRYERVVMNIDSEATTKIPGFRPPWWGSTEQLVVLWGRGGQGRMRLRKLFDTGYRTDNACSAKVKCLVPSVLSTKESWITYEYESKVARHKSMERYYSRINISPAFVLRSDCCRYCSKDATKDATNVALLVALAALQRNHTIQQRPLSTTESVRTHR
jgi:hypothetical protein